jgi:hypothetical protein
MIFVPSPHCRASRGSPVGAPGRVALQLADARDRDENGRYWGLWRLKPASGPGLWKTAGTAMGTAMTETDYAGDGEEGGRYGQRHGDDRDRDRDGDLW